MNENSNNCSCCGSCKHGTGENPCKDCGMHDSPDGYCKSLVCMCESAVAGRG